MNYVIHRFFSMYLFLFITLYVFRAHRVHHQERQIVEIQPLVTVILCWLPRCVQVEKRLFFQPAHISATNIEWRRLFQVFFQPAHISATNIEWLLPEAVLIQFVSPDDEHDVLETCTRVINRNKYIEKNMCITLVIYQESLHDARSTERKI